MKTTSPEELDGLSASVLSLNLVSIFVVLAERVILDHQVVFPGQSCHKRSRPLHSATGHLPSLPSASAPPSGSLTDREATAKSLQVTRAGIRIPSCTQRHHEGKTRHSPAEEPCVTHGNGEGGIS